MKDIDESETTIGPVHIFFFPWYASSYLEVFVIERKYCNCNDLERSHHKLFLAQMD